jgi:hypothetical protein
VKIRNSNKATYCCSDNASEFTGLVGPLEYRIDFGVQ